MFGLDSYLLDFWTDKFFFSQFTIEGGSANPELNATLRSIIDEAKRKNMPVATIQNTLKKYSDPNGIKLTKFYFDLRALGKVYMVVLLYTENLPATKQNMQAVLKKFPWVFKGFVVQK